MCSDRLNVFPFGFFFSLKRISSVNPKFVRFSPFTLIRLEMSAFLKTSSITAANSLDKSGIPCLTPHFIENSLNTNLSKWILNVSWLRMFCEIFYIRFVYVGFSRGFKDGKVLYCVKDFLVINEAYA